MSDSTKPVVVGVNGTSESMAAARWAAAVADKFSAPLQIVHGTPDAGHLLTDASGSRRADSGAYGVTVAAPEVGAQYPATVQRRTG